MIARSRRPRDVENAITGITLATTTTTAILATTAVAVAISLRREEEDTSIRVNRGLSRAVARPPGRTVVAVAVGPIITPLTSPASAVVALITTPPVAPAPTARTTPTATRPPVPPFSSLSPRRRSAPALVISPTPRAFVVCTRARFAAISAPPGPRRPFRPSSSTDEFRCRLLAPADGAAGATITTRTTDPVEVTPAAPPPRPRRVRRRRLRRATRTGWAARAWTWCRTARRTTIAAPSCRRASCRARSAEGAAEEIAS